MNESGFSMGLDRDLPYKWNFNRESSTDEIIFKSASVDSNWLTFKDIYLEIDICVISDTIEMKIWNEPSFGLKHYLLWKNIRAQYTPSSGQWEMKRHRRTATSKKVANAFSDSELPTWGTRDGEFKISSFVGTLDAIVVFLLVPSLFLPKIIELNNFITIH